jgi:hypothetical protein
VCAVRCGAVRCVRAGRWGAVPQSMRECGATRSIYHGAHTLAYQRRREFSGFRRKCANSGLSGPARSSEFTGPEFSGFEGPAVGFTGRIHQCARRAGLEADPRVGTSESGAQPRIGRTKIFSEGPKWTWTFANFFLHWTFSARVPPSVGLRSGGAEWPIHRSGIHRSDSPVGFTGRIHRSDSPVGFTGRIHRCARRAGLEAGPRVGTSESGAQPRIGRTKIFSEGPKWTWTFANFFLHWTFSARVAPSVGLRPGGTEWPIHRLDSPVGFNRRIQRFRAPIPSRCAHTPRAIHTRLPAHTSIRTAPHRAPLPRAPPP